MSRASSLLAAAACLGCATVEIDYQSIPSAEALAAMEPGHTTRSEVLARLGPPDEMRRPAAFEGLQLSNPNRRRILEAGDLFGRDAWTWSATHRSSRTIGLLPVGPALFRMRWSRSLEERIRIEFDPDDRVTSVSRVVEEAATDAGG
ncbi:MAG: hypothetical protein HKP30_00660 [Myxococcales bacterium]|nr:hypothetical protein [Myxococcales bacterium]